jgi:hypothetical protein
MSTALVPFDQLNTMATAFASSGMFGAKTKEQALSLLLLAQAEGVHPAIAMRDFDIINGRPAKKAEAMHRSFIAAGGKIEWHRLDDECADATFSHPQGGTARITWDMARARKAGLGNKDMYSKYPRQMLKARVVSEGCRTVFPAATSGLYVPEEVSTFAPPKEKDMGPAQVVQPDEDITQEIPGVGTQVSAPQGSPLSSSPIPAEAAIISPEQTLELHSRLTNCDSLAEEAFLRIAKLKQIGDLPAADYDEALAWVEKRKKRFAKS